MIFGFPGFYIFMKSISYLIVHQKGTVAVFQSGVGVEDSIVRLHYSCGHLGGGVDRETQLRFLPVVYRQSFHQQGGEP